MFQEGLQKFSKAAVGHLCCPVVSQREVARPHRALWSKLLVMHKASLSALESQSVSCLVKGLLSQRGALGASRVGSHCNADVLQGS